MNFMPKDELLLTLQNMKENEQDVNIIFGELKKQYFPDKEKANNLNAFSNGSGNSYDRTQGVKNVIDVLKLKNDIQKSKADVLLKLMDIDETSNNTEDVVRKIISTVFGTNKEDKKIAEEILEKIKSEEKDLNTSEEKEKELKLLENRVNNIEKEKEKLPPIKKSEEEIEELIKTEVKVVKDPEKSVEKEVKKQQKEKIVVKEEEPIVIKKEKKELTPEEK